MIHEIRGQEDMGVAVGGAGDKTLSLVITGSHVQITNRDPVQQVLYSIVAVPVFPADWRTLGVGGAVVEDMLGGAALHFRKKRYIRAVHAGERHAPAGTTYLGDDVTAQVEVSERTY